MQTHTPHMLGSRQGAEHLFYLHFLNSSIFFLFENERFHTIYKRTFVRQKKMLVMLAPAIFAPIFVLKIQKEAFFLIKGHVSLSMYMGVQVFFDTPKEITVTVYIKYIYYIYIYIYD